MEHLRSAGAEQRNSGIPEVPADPPGQEPGEGAAAGVDPRIAFKSDCELLNAKWDLESGRTVEFRITGDAYDRIHPFKRFTKRRGGRVGTRFAAMVGRVPTGEVQYRGEAMLAAWGDSSYSGQHFRLWLDDEAERHPFAGCTARRRGQPGDIFFVVLIELADDEQPIDQRTGEAFAEGAAGSAHGATGAHHRKTKLSQQVHLMVTNPMFVRYLEEQMPAPKKPWTKDTARDYAKQLIKVESLSDLDRDPEARKRFEVNLRRPYARWNGQEP